MTLEEIKIKAQKSLKFIEDIDKNAGMVIDGVVALEFILEAYQAGRDDYHDYIQTTGAYDVARKNLLVEIESELPGEKPTIKYFENNSDSGNFDDAYAEGWDASSPHGFNDCLNQVKNIIKGKRV